VVGGQEGPGQIAVRIRTARWDLEKTTTMGDKLGKNARREKKAPFFHRRNQREEWKNEKTSTRGGRHSNLRRENGEQNVLGAGRV